MELATFLKYTKLYVMQPSSFLVWFDMKLLLHIKLPKETKSPECFARQLTGMLHCLTCFQQPSTDILSYKILH